MKARILIASAFASLLFVSASAQDAANRSEDVSEKCKQNNSVFYQFAKSQSYADALAPWNELYTACPEYSKNIYKYGVLILKWQMSQEKDPAKVQAIADKLMGLYDNRIKYFGDDASYPTPRVLGLKAIDYITIATPNDPTKNEAYKWLEQAIAGLGNSSDAAFIQYYISLSVQKYQKDASHLDKLISDYIKTNDIIAVNVADSTNKYAGSYAQTKQANDALVGASKALTAETLDKIYKAKVEENKANFDYLNGVIGLYKTAGQVESDVYFAASAYAHKIKPSEESAVGCANMSNKKAEYSKAIEYLEQATQLSTSNSNKANYQMSIASIYADRLNSLSKAREAARNSIDFDGSKGDPYILIGSLYARSTGIYSDAVLAKTIYWVAVDKFIRAKQVDSSVAGRANDLINKYSRYFPADNDMFMHPDLEKGKSFTVGGWIGESTICR